MKNRIIALLSLLTLAACNQSPKKSSAEQSANTGNDEQTIQTLKEAYEFGYPLVVQHITSKIMSNVPKPVPARLMMPFNQLVNADQFPDDKFRNVVRPNCDTYYTLGNLDDVNREPYVLELPDTKGRYYLFPIADAWTNVFFSPGKRTTGTEGQKYLITGPDWKGEVPSSMQQVKSPTSMVLLMGRTQVNSAKDGATAVKKIQEGYKLTPLSAYGKPYTAPLGKVDATLEMKPPNDIAIAMPASDYFNLLNKLMVANPPAAADSLMLKKLAPFGIGPGAAFDASIFSAAVQDSLKSMPEWAKNDMMQHGLEGGKLVNGWVTSRGLGSYGTNYQLRAGIAYGGLGANLDADAMYPSSSVDADGEKYDGAKHSYILHFDAAKTPPANAFWSLTLYSNDGFLCANPISRFAIGDRNPLKKNADGSIDIYIQKDNPGKDKENNWLPAPRGAFNLLLRVYWPKEAMVNGSWQVPGVKKKPS